MQLVNDMGNRQDMAAIQAQLMADSAKDLLISAQQGGFGFQPEAAEIMIRALRESIDDIDSLFKQLIHISQAPKLGRTPAALVVAPFTLDVATGAQGLVLALQNFRQTMVDMIAAYDEAKKHYHDSDATIAHGFSRTPR